MSNDKKSPSLTMPQSMPRYFINPVRDTSRVTGPHRILELDGRSGIHPTSVHSVIEVGGHNLNAPRGSLTLWFFALEDLATSFMASHMAMDNPHYANYPFLSDCANPRNYEESRFFFGWFRYNELRAQFFQGHLHPTAFDPPQRAWVQAVPFNYFRKHQWYQLCVTWDEPAKDMRLYVNGILVGTSDRFNRDFHREPCGDTLYTGSTALCHGEIAFYQGVLTAEEIYRGYRAEVTAHREETERELRHVFSGENRQDFTFVPGADWAKKMDFHLRDPAHAEAFYFQGQADSVKPGAHPEGLLVETPDVSFEKKNRHQQVYLWTYQNFEGNLYLELEWKSLKPNGLALLLFQASGMAREDFMADYPKKTSGQMHTVHGQNVRNYHWEFYREMHDVRNDVGTAFSRKNPFSFRNGFGCAPEPFAIGEWHKLQLLQIEGRVRGAIDGKVLLSFDDESHTNTGCILNYGHVALRVMLHSKMLFRNLKVWNQALPFEEIQS